MHRNYAELFRVQISNYPAKKSIVRYKLGSATINLHSLKLHEIADEQVRGDFVTLRDAVDP